MIVCSFYLINSISPSLMEEYFQEYPRKIVINIRKDISFHWNCSWKIEDIPRNIPRNIRKDFLKNNTFNYDSFALENKMMITKNIPRNIPRNVHNNFLQNNTFNSDSFALENETMITKDIPRSIRSNFLKNYTFNCDSFALENKTMIHMGKHSFNSRRICNGYPSNF